MKKNAPPLASYVASKIASPLSRAFALQKIALYFFEAKDLVQAREIMNAAAKVAAESENTADKAVAFLLLTSAFTKIDEFRVPDTMKNAIGVINTLPRLESGERANADKRK